ncbi:MFS transporter [Paenibacillus durus]|uniref:MFS sugar transporter n=1 Tax=Paenibacillus durus ATCC 35681 TaxID=1333534 RepID=A0A0F7FC97_PAEDU|nr:MFS transporter [Paenibacillus durus]AKG36333.1 MFS sugar transporter [Paenibacillus durus ATCC 35681]
MSTKIYIALFSLALSAFAIGTTEFVLVGLLQTVASDLQISITRAGTLISGYAVAIAVGTPLIAILSGKVPKRRFLIILMAVFTLGNLLSAFSYSYHLLMLSRVLTAIAHGVFFAVAATVAVDLVPENKKGTAVSIMFTGLTVATIAGVPLGTYIGQHYGWRATFGVVAALGLIALVGNFLAIDKIKDQSSALRLRDIVKIISNSRILLALLMTALGFGGTFSLFTYLTPILEDISGFSASSVTLLLLVYGIAVAAGNLAGGKIANTHPVKNLRLVFLFQSVALLLQILLLPNKVLTIAGLIIMGFFSFMMSPGVQAYILSLSEKLAPSAKDLGSALNISAFNIGIAAGSTLGGYAVDYLDYLDTAWIGAVMVIAAMLLAIINYRLDKQQNLF